jgi:hypothetical protein
MKRRKPKVAEVQCPACDGTGYIKVAQPVEPDRKIYPARCKQCLAVLPGTRVAPTLTIA